MASHCMLAAAAAGAKPISEHCAFRILHSATAKHASEPGPMSVRTYCTYEYATLIDYLAIDCMA
jgi:hypothetical protein